MSAPSPSSWLYIVTLFVFAPSIWLGRDVPAARGDFALSLRIQTG